MLTRIKNKLLQSINIQLVTFLLCFICGCSTTVDSILPYEYPDLVDELEKTVDGEMVTKRYKGNIMYFFRRLLTKDNVICISTCYCGFGTDNHLVKYRIYAERKMIEHNEWGYQYSKEEYVSFRQESITTNNPMVLMLETRDDRGELIKEGFISQWESREYYDRFCRENGIEVQLTPTKK
ncbi:MAG: hypothetical protein WC125_10515 [Bacteroidales bacterium]|nr:hypothetical protein [Paludibacter sp.]